MKIVIMDIDGTLANAEHRLHLLPTGGAHGRQEITPSWEAFFAAANDDTPNPEIAFLSNALHDRAAIFVVTGRSEEQREMTSAWLEKHGILHDRLVMRPAGDRRPDTVVKKEILERFRAEGFEPWFAVEDRASVTRMWRDAGVRCLQVCEGDY